MGGELTVGGAEGVLGRVLACLDVAKHLRSHVFCYVEPGQDTTKYAFCATESARRPRLRGRRRGLCVGMLLLWCWVEEDFRKKK